MAYEQARHRQTARGCLSGNPVVWPAKPTLPFLRPLLQLDGSELALRRPSDKRHALGRAG
jgi:hypothetical protein